MTFGLLAFWPFGLSKAKVAGQQAKLGFWPVACPPLKGGTQQAKNPRPVDALKDRNF